MLLASPLQQRDKTLDQRTKMNWAEDKLWCLRQMGRLLERYVEEFIELSYWVSWHDAALGHVFRWVWMRIQSVAISLCDFPLVELINLALYLNGSNFEVEEMKENNPHPAPSETHLSSSPHARILHIPNKPMFRPPVTPKVPLSSKMEVE